MALTKKKRENELRYFVYIANYYLLIQKMINKNNFNRSHFFFLMNDFNLQSPTESLNSDSRPGSVLDEQENTNDPPDTPNADAERKDTETKVSEASPTDEANSNVVPKEEKPSATLPSNIDKPEPLTDKDKDASNDKPRSISGDDSSNSVDEKSETTTTATTTAANTATTTTATSQVSTVAKGSDSPAPAVPKATNSSSSSSISGTAAPTVTNTITSTSSTVTPSIPTSTITSSTVAPTVADLKPIEKIENAPVDASFTPKNEQEMISTIANIKKESNVPVTVENSNEYTGKKVAMVIKKEPGQDESTENSSNSSSTVGDRKDTIAEPSNEIKLVNEIKTENKCGLDLSDTNSKHDDASRSAFEPHIKFNVANKLPTESHVKFNSELTKPLEPIKFGQEPPLAVKYPPPMAADLSQHPKLFGEQPNKFESDTKDKLNMDGKCSICSFKMMSNLIEYEKLIKYSHINHTQLLIRQLNIQFQMIK